LGRLAAEVLGRVPWNSSATAIFGRLAAGVPGLVQRNSSTETVEVTAEAVDSKFSFTAEEAVESENSSGGKGTPESKNSSGGKKSAREAASAALEHLASIWPVQTIGEFDTEEFYDYQNNRPIVSVDESFNRSLTWPTTTVRGVSLPNYDRDLILVSGVEPSLKWRTFVGQLLDLGEDLDISMVVCLGSLLADVPHTRPIPVTATAARPEFGERLGLEMSRYEGPTGILGAIQDACNQREIDALSIWAAIPMMKNPAFPLVTNLPASGQSRFPAPLFP
jgi:hypothetical protein